MSDTTPRLDIDEQPFNINDGPAEPREPDTDRRPDFPMRDQPIAINDDTVEADA